MNSKAYSEVYQVIQYLPESEYRRIPLEKIKFLEEKMDKNVEKIFTITNNIEQLELSPEARTIFISLFYNYIANDEQKNKLKNFLAQEEKKVLEATYNRVFDNQKITNNNEEKNTALTVIPEETIFTKIKNMFFSVINKFKK